MPEFEPTRKLSTDQEEYRICSKPYVFFRMIVDKNGARLMTATASEDAGGYRAFEDQDSLIAATSRVVKGAGKQAVMKEDHARRPYVETSISLHREEAEHLSASILNSLGIHDAQILALQEILVIYDEFSIHDDEDAVYLNDGMWATSDGRIIEK